MIIIEVKLITISIRYLPVWRGVWAYTARETIGRGHGPRPMSQGQDKPIHPSRQVDI